MFGLKQLGYEEGGGPRPRSCDRGGQNSLGGGEDMSGKEGGARIWAWEALRSRPQEPVSGLQAFVTTARGPWP